MLRLRALRLVRLASAVALDAALKEAIVSRRRADGSPRHVPDQIVQVPAIPYTLTGKKMKIPVRDQNSSLIEVLIP
jgi:acetoacetyl-CoA synthetase